MIKYNPSLAKIQVHNVATDIDLYAEESDLWVSVLGSNMPQEISEDYWCMWKRC